MGKPSSNLAEYLSYCLIAIIFFLISESSMDMWDGVVASYASETGNHGGTRISLFAAGWYLQYFIYKGLFWLESFIGISFFKLSTLIAFVSSVLLAREIFLFSKKGDNQLDKLSVDYSSRLLRLRVIALSVILPFSLAVGFIAKGGYVLIPFILFVPFIFVPVKPLRQS